MKKLFLFSFILAALATNAQIKVISGGNVGIKNLTPARPLHVTGSAVFTSGSTISSYSPYIRGKNGTTTASSPEYSWVNDSITGIFHPDQNVLAFAIGGAEKARIHSNGYLGIGINSPVTLIDAQCLSEAKIRCYSTSTSNAYFLAQHSMAGFAFGVEGVSYNGFISTGNTSSQTKIMRFNTNGNFSIGSTAPSSNRLSIYSTNNRALYCDVSYSTDWGQAIVTKLNRPLSVSYVINYNDTDRFYIRGDGLACSQTGFYTWSDQRIKENINTITDPIQKIMNLRGVTYNLKKSTQTNAGDTTTYISPSPNPKQMGLIAQEVQSIVPEVVIDMPDGNKAIAYQNLVGLLIEAIKVQQQKINEEDERISALQNELVSCCVTGSTKDMMINNTHTSNQTNETNRSASLMQNVPNPFSTKTVIRYYIPENTTTASLMIFDMQGKLIKTYPVNNKKEGYTEINGGEMQPGMYMYSLIIDGKELDTKRMILTE